MDKKIIPNETPLSPQVTEIGPHETIRTISSLYPDQPLSARSGYQGCH